MSSAVYIKFDKDTVGVPLEEWEVFCRDNQIEHSPRTIGGNIYYYGGYGGVEISHEVHRVRVSTFWMGKAIPDVARLARLIWQRWGGSLEADSEVRPHMWNTK